MCETPEVKLHLHVGVACQLAQVRLMTYNAEMEILARAYVTFVRNPGGTFQMEFQVDTIPIPGTNTPIRELALRELIRYGLFAVWALIVGFAFIWLVTTRGLRSGRFLQQLSDQYQRGDISWWYFGLQSGWVALSAFVVPHPTDHYFNHMMETVTVGLQFCGVNAVMLYIYTFEYTLRELATLYDDLYDDTYAPANFLLPRRRELEMETEANTTDLERCVLRSEKSWLATLLG